MTSTITAEERAAEVVRLDSHHAELHHAALLSQVEVPDAPGLKTLIASAIRQAEDAAYERAAAVVLHRKVLLGDQPAASWNAGYGDGYLDASDGAAMAINRLKSPSPPKEPT